MDSGGKRAAEVDRTSLTRSCGKEQSRSNEDVSGSEACKKIDVKSTLKNNLRYSDEMRIDDEQGRGKRKRPRNEQAPVDEETSSSKDGDSTLDVADDGYCKDKTTAGNGKSRLHSNGTPSGEANPKRTTKRNSKVIVRGFL